MEDGTGLVEGVAVSEDQAPGFIRNSRNARPRATNRRHERAELRRVQVSGGPDSIAEIYAVRPNVLDRRLDVVRAQPAGQIDRAIHRLDDARAQRPIVGAPGS